MSAAGRFIVLEGVDGSGTTTQTERLVQRLRAHGYDARATREPTAGPVGSLLREVLARRLQLGSAATTSEFAAPTLSLLFAADRLDHLGSFIEPALREGAVVVSDRYDLSSYVYQSATASSAEAALAWLRELNRHARRPELTLVLRLSPEEAERRRALRGGPVELFEQQALQRRLARLYAQAGALVPADRLEWVEAEGEVSEVEERIWAAVRPVVEAAPASSSASPRRRGT